MGCRCGWGAARGCPVLDTGGSRHFQLALDTSSWLQRAYCSTQLSLSAKLVALLGKGPWHNGYLWPMETPHWRRGKARRRSGREEPLSSWQPWWPLPMLVVASLKGMWPVATAMSKDSSLEWRNGVSHELSCSWPFFTSCPTPQGGGELAQGRKFGGQLSTSAHNGQCCFQSSLIRPKGKLTSDLLLCCVFLPLSLGCGCVSLGTERFQLASALEKIGWGGQEGSSLTSLCKWRVLLKGPIHSSPDLSPFFT